MPDPAPAHVWYLVQFKPNCAEIGRRHLGRQGFECFLPLERQSVRRNGRFTEAIRPYFPGYLFVAIEPRSAPWRAIRSTQGVARLVCLGATPAPVPAAVVEELMQSCDADGCVLPSMDLKPGDTVQLATGPLASFIGRVERLAPDERAWVLLEIMGKETRVSVQRADIRLAS